LLFLSFLCVLRSPWSASFRVKFQWWVCPSIDWCAFLSWRGSRVVNRNTNALITSAVPTAAVRGLISFQSVFGDLYCCLTAESSTNIDTYVSFNSVTSGSQSWRVWDSVRDTLAYARILNAADTCPSLRTSCWWTRLLFVLFPLFINFMKSRNWAIILDSCYVRPIIVINIVIICNIVSGRWGRGWRRWSPSAIPARVNCLGQRWLSLSLLPLTRRTNTLIRRVNLHSFCRIWRRCNRSRSIASITTVSWGPNRPSARSIVSARGGIELLSILLSCFSFNIQFVLVLQKILQKISFVSDLLAPIYAFLLVVKWLQPWQNTASYHLNFPQNCKTSVLKHEIESVHRFQNSAPFERRRFDFLEQMIDDSRTISGICSISKL